MRKIVVLVPLVVGGCGFRHCEPVDPATLADLPDRLSQTGLFDDVAAEVLAPGVIAYEPRFELWSDGAEKRRWIAVPGEIDTTEADSWRFPEGTRAWKEFAVDGEKVETRMIAKLGPGDADWTAVAYRWDGDDAVKLPEGEADSHGTSHDIPTAEECLACHGGRASFVLGYTAVQTELVEVPGTELDQQALGYLSANCSHCHNDEGLRKSCYDPGRGMDFSLTSGLASVEEAPALQTAHQALAPGRPDESEVLQRMSHRQPNSVVPTTMPPLATEQVDDDAVEMLRTWIGGL